MISLKTTTLSARVDAAKSANSRIKRPGSDLRRRSNHPPPKCCAHLHEPERRSSNRRVAIQRRKRADSEIGAPMLRQFKSPEPSVFPRGFGVRWLAGNGADTAFGPEQTFDVGCSMLSVRCFLPSPKRCVPSPLTHRSPRRCRAIRRFMVSIRGLESWRLARPLRLRKRGGIEK